MDEKVMVADTLQCINSSLKSFGEMITQTENVELRQKMIQMRNSCETSQYELFKMAKEHGYYQPAEPATSEEINAVKSIFC